MRRANCLTMVFLLLVGCGEGVATNPDFKKGGNGGGGGSNGGGEAWEPTDDLVIMAQLDSRKDPADRVYVSNSAIPGRLVQVFSAPWLSLSEVSWSPDGDLVFGMDVMAPGIYSLSRNESGSSSDPRLMFALNLYPRHAHPAFSPDGAKLAYVDGDASGLSQVFVRPVVGTGPLIFGSPQQVTFVGDSSDAHYNPSWASDSRTLAVKREILPPSGGVRTNIQIVDTDPDGNGIIDQIMSRDISGDTPITLMGFQWVDFDPEGDRVLASATPPTGNSHRYEEIVEYDFGVSTPSEVCDLTGDPLIVDRSPTFSPDGSRFASLRTQLTNLDNWIEVRTIGAAGPGCVVGPPSIHLADRSSGKTPLVYRSVTWRR